MTAAERPLTDTAQELPDDLRVPLHSLQADTRYLFGRVAADGTVAGMMADSVLDRLSQIESALYHHFLANAHDALVDALKVALYCLVLRADPDRPAPMLDSAIGKARAALAGAAP